MILLEVVTLKGKPIGLVAATSKSHIGYALYNTVKEKRSWDIGLAAKIAIGRAEANRTDPMESLFDTSEMFRLIIEKSKDTKRVWPGKMISVDRGFFAAKDGLRRVFLMTKAVKKMIFTAKRRRW